MARLAEQALVGFAALMAVAWPAPPLPGHAAWADLFMLVAASAFALAALSDGRRPRLRTGAVGHLAWAALGYLAWAALSAAVHRTGGWKVLGIAELVCVLMVTAEVARDERARDRLLHAWIAGAVALSVIGLGVAILATLGLDTGPLLVGSGELGLSLRPAGLCSTGMLAELDLVPLLLLFTDGERLVGRRRRAPLLGLLAVTVALSATRTILAVAAGLLFLGALRAGRARRALVGIIALALIALASVRIDIHRSGAPGIRWRIAASALATARAHPLVGVGPTARPAHAAWPGPNDPVLDWDAHSTVLDLAATLGLPGLLAFLLLVAWIVDRSRHAPAEPVAIALRAGLYATLFDALTVDVEDFRHVWLLFGLMLAVTAGARCGPAARRRAPPASTEPSPSR